LSATWLTEAIARFVPAALGFELGRSEPPRRCRVHGIAVRTVSLLARAIAVAALIAPAACLRPPPEPANPTVSHAMWSSSGTPAPSANDELPLEPMAEIDAWAAVSRMSPGINIGNTLENITHWETGWGNPPITEEYVRSLAALGFRTVRVPVAWDTYAVDGRIQTDKLARVSEVVGWITGAGMFCVLNIHWDGGWIDSSWKERYRNIHVFSPEAERKYRSYWEQISSFFAGKNEKLIFEALNEETNFDNVGSVEKAYATLTRVNQLFIDTVRRTGGNNAKRLLIVTGYATDITKTSNALYSLPKDTIAHRLFISVHYYTPWPFAGMTEDANWGKMAPTWGSPSDVQELNRLFDMMAEFCSKNDIPAFIGEFSVTEKKESASRVRWLSAVMVAALSRKMVPVLWDTGHGVSRLPPHTPSADLHQVLQHLAVRR
jgi:endoglucanase